MAGRRWRGRRPQSSAVAADADDADVGVVGVVVGGGGGGGAALFRAAPLAALRRRRSRPLLGLQPTAILVLWYALSLSLSLSLFLFLFLETKPKKKTVRRNPIEWKSSLSLLKTTTTKKQYDLRYFVGQLSTVLSSYSYRTYVIFILSYKKNNSMFDILLANFRRSSYPNLCFLFL